MNKELIKQSTEILELLKQSIVSGKDIAAEHLPEVCQQLITYEIFIRGLWTLISLLTIVVGVLGIMKAIKEYKKDSYMDELWMCASVMSFMVGVIAMVFAGFNITALIKPLIAPKVFLIEKITSLIL